MHDAAEFDLTDISDKLDKNKLSESVRAMVKPAVPVARLVESYMTRHPDPDYPRACRKHSRKSIAALLRPAYLTAMVFFGRLCDM